MVSVSPPGFVATSRPASSRTVHGGLIQFSGLYAFVSACTAIDPSAFRRIRRGAGGRRAPKRPWYSTEQFATNMRTTRVVPHPCASSAVDVRCPLLSPPEVRRRGPRHLRQRSLQDLSDP